MRPTFAAMLLLALAARPAFSADEYELPPIEYSRGTPENAVSRLQEKLDSGAHALRHEDRFGYLQSVLDALEIRPESQTLVFSKTSLQRHRISPRTPRAIYFNDDVYLGYCHEGDVLEISVADPQLGTVFYTIDQDETDKPKFVRQTDQCLLCHGMSQTDGIPGHRVRSLFVDTMGNPLLAEGSHRVDQTTPFENRWGGWYVTGTHGEQKHLGNLLIRNGEVPRPVQNEKGLNVTDLTPFFDVSRYPTPHSDIVALMVLEHQSMVHNLLTKANFAARQALHYESELNRALGEPSDRRLDSTTRRIRNAADALLQAMLCSKEAPLTAAVAGTSEYAQRFTNAGPRDKRGRSLRDFDLKTRLFRYPCSFLVYSASFDRLPDEMKLAVTTRLRGILTGTDKDEAYAHLAADDRRAILEILTDTKPELWRSVAEK
ncbi:MAG: hypothetical protein IT428_24590 [Planctomycetaceae bacterium]|nr:hypothetical protein [Planctomycetaceae bacterium]